MNELFIYGTLLPGHCRSSILESLGPIGWTPARMPGRLFDTGLGYPAMIESDSARWESPDAADTARSSLVEGECVTFSDFRTAAEVLDRVEGFHADSPRESLYLRVQKVAKTHAGVPRNAWVYLYNQPVAGMREIESGRWEGP